MKWILSGRGFIIIYILYFLIINIQINDAFSKSRPSYKFKIEKEIIPYPPHLGEEIEVIFTVISPYDLDDTRFMLWPLRGGKLISLEPIGFSAREETNERFMIKRNIKKWIWFKCKAKEKRKFKVKVKIDDSIPDERTNETFKFEITVAVESWTEEHRSGVGSSSLQLFLIDKEKGIFGTRTELKKGKPIIYRYDAEKRKIIPPRMRDIQVDVEKNKEIIAMLRKSEPSLSDSEALQLHRDFLRIGIPIDFDSLDEEKIYRYYLSAGWLDAMRAGKREEWINKEKMIIAEGYLKEYKKRKWFFRNFPLILGTVCSIALIFLIGIKTKLRKN